MTGHDDLRDLVRAAAARIGIDDARDAIREGRAQEHSLFDVASLIEIWARGVTRLRDMT